MFRHIHRRLSGQAIIALGLLIAIFVILPIGLLAFEIGRVEVARMQLRAATESAGLGAAATLASQDNLDPAQAHQQAVDVAFTLFRQNQVAGSSLSAATRAGTAADSPSAEQSSLYIEFLDPNNNNTPVPQGDPRGKTVRITGAFGLRPAFAQYLGLSTVPIRATAAGGVPDLDVVVCFDVSGSIDDQTPVTFVRRQWNTATAKIVYIVPPTYGASPVKPLATGKIYDIIGPPATGTRVNGVYPHYFSSSNQGDVRWPLNFSEESGTSRGLRGAANAGSPPGNCPPGTASTGGTYTYTDMVVNIDGKDVFGGMVADGYAFPDVATLVEAARGNLENNVLFVASKANTGLPPAITPRTGYQAKYFEYARRNLHPIGDAQLACSDFFTIMNTNTDAHFGFVAFSDNAGMSADGTYGEYNVDASYPAAGTGRFPIPNVELNPAVGVTNYATIEARIPTTVATTATNIGEATYKAVLQLKNNSRQGAKKAIVLFTDGEPTAGGPLDGDPWSNSRKAAVEARNAGIPIYAIGLAQNPEIIPSETAILNDTNSNPTSGGMAAIAGNGGKFFLVTKTGDLRKTFENVARQLVQLVD